jgi:hypothetical protein
MQKVTNLQSLLSDIAGLPHEMRSMGFDSRYLFQQLRNLGFVKVNEKYYRQILEHKGQRVIIGCRLNGSMYTIMIGQKKLTNGRYIDHASLNREIRENLQWAMKHGTGNIILPNNLQLFDPFSLDLAERMQQNV